jgi:predicted dithiol-disulfide oxidoreductase (DUF899 family)
LNYPNIVSREEWLVARNELLMKEKAVTRAHDQVNAERRRLPMVKIEKEYLFESSDGKASLLDLFDGRRQLLIYHFMFDPNWDEGCKGCSFLIDNVGHLAHLHARDTSLAVISRAPLTKIEPFKRRMNWTVPWFSSYGSDFNYDFHVTLDEAVAPVEYNYRGKAEHEQAGTAGYVTGEWPIERPGTSCFLRDGDAVFHTYSSYARGEEATGGAYYYLDLTALGRQEEWEEPQGRATAAHDASPDFSE